MSIRSKFFSFIIGVFSFQLPFFGGEALNIFHLILGALLSFVSQFLISRYEQKIKRKKSRERSS